MDIRSQLNEKQYQAAASESQYLRIIAGAGTGKTRTLSYKIAYLIEKGFAPRRIVAITFTNKAAKEMQSRVSTILSEESDVVVYGKPLMSTFHGFCYRFLRKEISQLHGYTDQFTIAGDDDTNAIYKEIFSKMSKGVSKEFTKAITSRISQLKTDGIFEEEVRQDNCRIPLGSIYTFEELKHVYHDYQHYLKSQNLLDFDDLLMLTVKIMEENPVVRATWQQKYDIFLIDEFQDTNYIQYHLVRLFMSPTTRLTVVGDPDQTIYTWRGARNHIIKDQLQKDYPTLETVILDDNYRSTQSILNAANVLIKHNRDRMDKSLNAASGVEGDKVDYTPFPDGNSEAYSLAGTINSLHKKFNVPYQDIAVIYRSNYLSNPIEKQLTMFRIPYEIYGGLKFYERAEIKDAISYLRLAVNPDDFSFLRVLKAPSKGIGDVKINQAKAFRAMTDEDMNLLTIFRNHQEEIGITKAQKAKLDVFYAAFERFCQVLANRAKPAEIVSGIRNYFIESGFTEYVHSEDVKAQEKLSYTAASSTSKVDNVNELLSTIDDFFDHDVIEDDGTVHAPQLEDFLIEVALQSDQDTMTDTDKVALMTGHVSKGLEFPYVFVTGLNNGVFPTTHAMMGESGAAIEEERRLLYVCMTRAKKKLYLSSFGGTNFRNGAAYQPSMFIKEIKVLEKPKPPVKNYDAYRGQNRPFISSSTSSIGIATMPKANTFLGHATQNQPTGKESYHCGDHVIHTSFGKGEVIKVEGNKITVQFAEPYGQKKLVIGFKAFRKLNEGE